MKLLAIDLAAKYSAACLMDDNYQVLDQFDSWGRTEESFLYLCVGQFSGFEQDQLPDVMIVEDLPHGLAYSTLVKTVLRLQGRLVQALHEMPLGMTEDIVFLAPTQWRNHYALKRGTGSDIVVPTAAQFGYTAPAERIDAIAQAKGKLGGGKAIARKVATDYCAAYLIARFAHDMHKEHATYDVVGTSRYATSVIRKKDTHGQDN